MSFLSANGFQFEVPITKGVQYLSRSEEQLARENMASEEARLANLADIDIKPEDRPLVAHIQSSLKKWMAEPVSEREESLNIPDEPDSSLQVPQTLNRRQIRLAHQVVRNEFVGLQTMGMGHFVRVTAPTEEQQASAKLVKARERERTISNAVGFRWLIEGLVGGNIGGLSEEYIIAGSLGVDMKGLTPREFIATLQARLRDRPKIVVGHNCFTDLINFYKCFIGPLPDAVEDFADEIHSLFPAVIDTKHVASFGSKRWGDTSLQGVEFDLRQERFPEIHVPAEFDGYTHQDRLHEAGYDSLLTARIAILYSAKMEREGKYLDGLSKTELRQSPMSAFGAADDEYVTAAESADDEIGSINATPAGIVSAGTPILEDEAVKKQATAATSSQDESRRTNAELDGPVGQSLLAVKERSAAISEKAEIEKFKTTPVLRPNIYALLGADEDPAMPESEGLNTPDRVVEDERESRTNANIDKMVKEGRLMPRWDNATGYWKFFGNKLQVNSSQEGLCKLD